MPNRLFIAYVLLGLLLIALLAFAALVLRRRRAEHDLRWRNRKRWKRR
jgi:LPXTG-motif cell wall-anchored protein